MGCNSIKLNNSWWMITPWRHSCGSWSLVGGEWLGGCVCVYNMWAGWSHSSGIHRKMVIKGRYFFPSIYGWSAKPPTDFTSSIWADGTIWVDECELLCEFWDRARQNSNDSRIGSSSSSRRALRQSDKPSGNVSRIKKESLKNSFFFFFGYNIKGMDKIARLISMELVRCSKTL